MKKVIALGLIARMAMSLAACGSSGTTTTTAAQSETTATSSSSGSSSDAAGDPEVNITFAHADAPDGSVNGEGAKMFKQLVEEKSGGSIIVDIYPSAQLGSVSEVIASVQNNSVDMTNISTSFLSNFCPEVGVFDMPFLFEDYAHVWEAEDGELGDTLGEKLKAVNINPEFWNGFGFRNVTTSKNRVLNSIDDFKGLRIRIQPSDIQKEIFSALGADPAPIDWGELYTALQQGTVDAEENPFIQIYSSNIFEVNPVIYKTEHEWGGAVCITSNGLREKLTYNQKAVFDECIEEIKPQWRKLVQDMNDDAVKGLEEKGCEYKDDVFDKAELQEKVQSVYDNHPEYAELVEYVKSLR